MRFLLPILMMMSFMIYAQNHEIDSLQNQLKRLPNDSSKVKTYLLLVAQWYRADKIQEAIETDSQALLLSRKIGYKAGESEALEKFGTIYYYDGIYEKGIDFYTQALKLRQEIGDEKAESYLLNNLGIIHMNRTDYQLAATYLLKARDINHQLKNQKALGSIYTNLGLIVSHHGLYDSAILLQRLALYYNNKHGHYIGSGSNFLNIGTAQGSLGNTDSAVYYYQQALLIYDSIPDHATRPKSYYKSRVYSLLGRSYAKQGNNPKALEAYQISLKMREELGNKRGQANVTTNLGKFYMELDDYDKAKEYFELSLKLKNELKDVRGTAIVLDYQGQVYQKELDYKNALIKFHQALQLNVKNNIAVNLARNYNHLASVHEDLSQYDSALFYYANAYSIFDSLKVKEGVGNSLLGIGRIEARQNVYNSATSNLKRAMYIAEEVKSVQLLKDASEHLAQTYEQLGNSSQALKYFKLFHQIKDSLDNSENTEKITRLEMQYEFDREKSLLLSSQAEEERLLQKKLKERQLTIYITLVGTILILILATNLYLSGRRRKRYNGLIKAQKDQLEELSGFKEGLTYMIAHDMKNSLNNIIGLSAQQPAAQTMHGIQQSGVMMLNLVTNMLDIQRFKETEVPLDKKEVLVQDVFLEARSQTELLVKSSGLNLHLDTPNHLKVNVDFDILVRVIINLITNAIKYTPVGRLITLRAIQDGPYAILKVIDQGTGIKSEKIPHIFDRFWQSNAVTSGQAVSTGLGLSFCKLAVEAHGGQISVESQIGLGSTFNIHMTAINVEQNMLEQEVHRDNSALIYEEEKALILSYTEQIVTLNLYQVGELNEIFDEMENRGIQSPWLQHIRAAVQTFDEQKYHELLIT